jgi:hypothetical protein
MAGGFFMPFYERDKIMTTKKLIQNIKDCGQSIIDNAAVIAGIIPDRRILKL